MHAFQVTVKTEAYRITYSAISQCSCDLVDAAIDTHGICAVSVHPIGG